MYNEPIKIQIGKIFMNRTRKYLLPLIKKYGDEFTFHINQLSKVAVGIGDMVVKKCGFQHEKHLFILVDSRYKPFRFVSTLNWIREHQSYEDDYVFGNIQSSRFHMIVIRIPDSYLESMEHFRDGRYSKMYSSDDVRQLFSTDGKTGFDRTLYETIIKVLVHDHNYMVEFAEQVKLEFQFSDHDYSVHDIDPESEFDLPMSKFEEIFNYKKV